MKNIETQCKYCLKYGKIDKWKICSRCAFSALFSGAYPIKEVQVRGEGESPKSLNGVEPRIEHQPQKSIVEQVYLQANEIARYSQPEQIVGDMNCYYVTLGQLETILENFKP